MSVPHPDFAPQPPASGRRSIGGISLLLAVALACSGAVNEGMYFGAVRAAAETARLETGLPRQSARPAASRREIVPAIPSFAIRQGCRGRDLLEPTDGVPALPAGARLLQAHLLNLPPPRG